MNLRQTLQTGLALGDIVGIPNRPITTFINTCKLGCGHTVWLPLPY
jgi:hypothetical protein